MFDAATEIGDVVLRTLIVYLALTVGLRLVGGRQLGQLSLPDFVVVLLIANSVQNAMVGSDVSIQAGLASAATLLVANLALERLVRRSARLGRALEGEAVLLVKDGELLRANLDREGIDDGELRSILREHGVEDPSGVRVAYLEPDGTVSVIPASASVVRTERTIRSARRSDRGRSRRRRR